MLFLHMTKGVEDKRREEKKRREDFKKIERERRTERREGGNCKGKVFLEEYKIFIGN